MLQEDNIQTAFLASNLSLNAQSQTNKLDPPQLPAHFTS
jgi:hypothetical protein